MSNDKKGNMIIMEDGDVLDLSYIHMGKKLKTLRIHKTIKQEGNIKKEYHGRQVWGNVYPETTIGKKLIVTINEEIVDDDNKEKE